MKMIMAALTASALLAGVAAPASADDDLATIAKEYTKVVGSEKIDDAKLRRDLTKQIERLADTLPTGSSDWWQQMDREGRGGRR